LAMSKIGGFNLAIETSRENSTRSLFALRTKKTEPKERKVLDK